MYKQKPRRLPGFDYRGETACSVRFCTRDREPVFISAAAVEIVLLQFLRAAAATHVAVVAYCFMPDHVHLLVQGMDNGADVRRFIRLAKQYSGYQYSKRFGRPIWQRLGYERVLRASEAVEVAARYILWNPVRAGLVKRAEDYPFSGSQTHDVKDLMAPGAG
jgi:putative transposase